MPTLDEQIVLAISADVSNLRRAVVQVGGVVTELSKTVETGFANVATAADNSANKVVRISQRQRQQVSANAKAMADSVIAETSRSTAFAANNARNLTFQINDVMQALTSGQGLRGIAQQFGQITQAFTGTGIRATLAELLSGSNLLTLGLLAAGAAATYFVNNLADDDPQKKLKAEADLLDEVAQKWGDLVPIIQRAAKARDEALAQEKTKGAAEIAITDNYVKLQPVIDKVVNGLKEFKAEIARGAIQTDQQKAAVQELTDAENMFVQAAEKHILTQTEVSRLQNAVAGAVDTTTEAYANYQALLLQAGETIQANAKADAQARKEALKATLDSIDSQKEYDKALKEMMDIVKPAKNDVQAMWEAYDAGVKAAAGDTSKLSYLLDELFATMKRINENQLQGFTDEAVKGLDDYASRVAQIESGNNPNAHAPVGSASGLFQFTDSTFRDVIRSIDKYASLTDEQIQAGKNNVQLQKDAFEKFTNDNAKYLADHGQAITAANLYLAHFLGKQGAINLLQSPRNMSAAAAAGEAATAANPSILGRGQTVQDVIDWANRKLAGAKASVSTHDTQEDIDKESEKLDVLKQQNIAYDEQYAKQQADLKFIDLKAAHSKELEQADKADRDALLADLRAQADQYGVIEAKQKAAKEDKGFEERLQGLKDQNAELQKEAELNGTTLEALEAKLSAQERQQALNEAEVETLKIVNDYKEKGITLTQDQTAAILEQQQALQLGKAGIKEFGDQQKETQKSMEDFSEQLGGVFKSAIGGFINDLRNGKSAGEAFRNMLDRLIDGLVDMALQALFSKNALGGLFGVLGGGGGGGGGGSFLAALFGYRKGGVVGKAGDGERMMADPRWFIGAPSMARGGPVLPYGAVPIIAHQGETILPRGAKIGGGDITNNVGDVSIDMSGTGLVTSTTEQGKLLGRQIQAAVQVVLVQESRPGGILRKQPGAR